MAYGLKASSCHPLTYLFTSPRFSSCVTIVALSSSVELSSSLIIAANTCFAASTTIFSCSSLDNGFSVELPLVLYCTFMSLNKYEKNSLALVMSTGDIVAGFEICKVIITTGFYNG